MLSTRIVPMLALVAHMDFMKKYFVLRESLALLVRVPSRSVFDYRLSPPGRRLRKICSPHVRRADPRYVARVRSEWLSGRLWDVWRQVVGNSR